MILLAAAAYLAIAVALAVLYTRGATSTEARIVAVLVAAFWLPAFLFTGAVMIRVLATKAPVQR